jgi:hypothetical protein
MVYIGFEDLRFPSLCFSGRYLVCCLEWNAEGRLIVPLLAGQKRRA